ncbi:uncharacterized protein LOC130090477 [Rhinichthys klamathensis goyatoka]|uniref:uncharacterized protein LOC130090477 n=1 Tax=Rhinichthys klamathensis goyatoka TaxID=3034132 RepID=UPI0024B56603|nr:uncharacterized protein LOC130090477 [Rhinichthys klamathensis goyatoka]
MVTRVSMCIDEFNKHLFPKRKMKNLGLFAVTALLLFNGYHCTTTVSSTSAISPTSAASATSAISAASAISAISAASAISAISAASPTSAISAASAISVNATAPATPATMINGSTTSGATVAASSSVHQLLGAGLLTWMLSRVQWRN